jgi:acetyl-CoA carboxylase biotin carboxyl carrier protein
VTKIEQVRQLSEWLQGTDITLLELTAPGEEVIRLRRGGAGVPSATQPTNFAPPVGWVREATPASTTVVRAGSVGLLLHTHPLRSEPLVKVGQQVAAGQALALLKIGLVLLPVSAPRAGVVSRIVAPDASAVGFGEPLIELA